MKKYSNKEREKKKGRAKKDKKRRGRGTSDNRGRLQCENRKRRKTDNIWNGEMGREKKFEGQSNKQGRQDTDRGTEGERMDDNEWMRGRRRRMDIYWREKIVSY